MSNTRKIWTERCEKHLVGKKIVQVRYLNKKEMDDLGWEQTPLVIFFNDGVICFLLEMMKGMMEVHCLPPLKTFQQFQSSHKREGGKSPLFNWSKKNRTRAQDLKFQAQAKKKCL